MGDGVAKDLDGVFNGDLATLRGGESGEVHQAGHVTADEEIWFLFEDVVELERSHFSRDVREGDGECAAEAAALFALAEGDQGDILDRSLCVRY